MGVRIKRKTAMTSDKWDIPWHMTGKCCITILYHTKENTLTKIPSGIRTRAAYGGKGGFNAVESETLVVYTTGFQ